MADEIQAHFPPPPPPVSLPRTLLRCWWCHSLFCFVSCTWPWRPLLSTVTAEKKSLSRQRRRVPIKGTATNSPQSRSYYYHLSVIIFDALCVPFSRVLLCSLLCLSPRSSFTWHPTGKKGNIAKTDSSFFLPFSVNVFASGYLMPSVCLKKKGLFTSFLFFVCVVLRPSFAASFGAVVVTIFPTGVAFLLA